MKKEVSKDKKIRRRKRRIVIFGTLFLLLFSGIFIGNRWARAHGFNSIWDFISTTSTNYVSSWNATYETVEITISESDFNKLQSQRDYHLANGIITKVPDRYVPAIISYEGQKIKSKIRLKGHMTDHLQNNKWSFRVKTVGGDNFKGMRIFSLMHPGTRNYIYEWIYHKMLEEEGIVSVRYSFIKLKVNDEDWGIYAVEENFGSELIRYHRKPNGPIIGFNPDLYWYARLNDHHKIDINVENIYIGASYPEAFDESSNFKDAESKSNYVEATILLEKFRRGELSTSEVFDVKKLAKFHAIIDLVGGHFSLDWSDVKYYYNPLMQKIEPIGYESFSVQNIKELSGASKFKSSYNKQNEWHVLLFSDADYFKEYIKALHKINKKQYLDTFFEKYKSEIKNNLAILYKDYPYKKLGFEQYYTNQKNITALLDAPIVPAIYFNEYREDTLFFTVGCNAVLPIELKKIEIGDTILKMNEQIIFTTRNRNEPVRFQKLKIPVKGNYEKKDLKKIQFYVSYLGMVKEEKIDVKPIDVTGQLLDDFVLNSSTISKFSFLQIDEKRKEIIIKAGSHSVNENLIIPNGYKVLAKFPLQLDLVNSSRIISYSPVEFIGDEENTIELYSSDSTGKGIVLLNENGNSIFKFVNFINLGLSISKEDSYQGIINIYQTNASFNNCIISSKAELGIYCVGSKLNISGGTYFNQLKNGLLIDYSEINFYNLILDDIKKIGLELHSTIGKINKLNINKTAKPIELQNFSIIKGEDWRISNAEIGIISNDLSKLEISKLIMKNVELGFEAEKKDELYGPSVISIKGFKKEKVNKLKSTDTKSKVILK